MYSLLSYEAQDQYSEEVFVAIYQQFAQEVALVHVTSRILAAYQPGFLADVSFATSFQSALAGSFEVENRLTLSYDLEGWGVNWSPALILPQLSDETQVRLTTRRPSRGNIYDRNGLGLAVQGERVEIGVIPGQIEDETVPGAICCRPSGPLRRCPTRLVRAPGRDQRRDGRGLLRQAELYAWHRAS
jgi:hypothetical protein